MGSLLSPKFSTERVRQRCRVPCHVRGAFGLLPVPSHAHLYGFSPYTVDPMVEVKPVLSVSVELLGSDARDSCFILQVQVLVQLPFSDVLELSGNSKSRNCFGELKTFHIACRMQSLQVHLLRR